MRRVSVSIGAQSLSLFTLTVAEYNPLRANASASRFAGGPETLQIEAMEWIKVYEEPRDVASLEGIVYSTSPKRTQATDERFYFLKGPDRKIVIAEALGYELAKRVGLAVPRAALCHMPRTSDIWFASEEADVRSGIETMLGSPPAVNPELLGACIAFDVWVVNRDRNLGNIVAQQKSNGRVELRAIDFEKAEILRGTDRFSVTAIEAKECRPRGLLGTLCSGIAFPESTCNLIGQIGRTDIESVFDSLAGDLGQSIDWKPRATDMLENRSGTIDQLVREALDE